ncbi:MAG: hypothetical protein KBB52_00675 [Candidatus Omnitrophica bacterium]|nr:hypothetical protein [Candidatus Omnitrophota bacterium]
MTKHYALIPAKEESSRCINKNWRKFIGDRSLVDFAISTVPSGIFEKISISTDKLDFVAPKGVVKHLRRKSMATKNSCVKDVIRLLIEEYDVADNDYLWLLNPTSPFRARGDYASITGIIKTHRPDSVVSALKLHPFIWKDGKPLFETKGKRKNTEDFKEEYLVENGMFYVFRAGAFCRTHSWYSGKVCLYRQKGMWPSVDIDTEEDFIEAQELAKMWTGKKRR